MKMHHAIDMYDKFRKDNSGTDVNYTLFKYIISAYNKGIVQHLLTGGTFHLGAGLGRLKISKIKRDFSKRKTINWGETRKHYQQGIEKLVYYTDEYYYRFTWFKKYCNIKNKSAYNFRPAGGVKGPKKQLVELLKKDEFAHLNFTAK